MSLEREQQEGPSIGAQVSEEAFENDPVLTQYQTEAEQAHWTEELSAARKERKQFNEDGVKIIKRYSGESTSARNAPVAESSYNIFFANTEIKQAALHAHTPIPSIKRRFSDPDDQASRVAANILQRNISYELDCENFDATFKQISFDRLVPGIGIGWLRLEQEATEPQYTVGLDATGQPAHQMVPGSDIGYQIAAIDYVAWNDFVWAPCRYWQECRWVGRRVPMSKQALHARFDGRVDPDVLKSITFSKPSSSVADTSSSAVDSMRPKNITEPTTDIYEFWDKERELIFWFSEGASVPLDVQGDTNEFEGFFPTPLPPLGRFNNSNTTPISDFSLVKTQYNELDELNTRAMGLLNTLKVRWMYDSSNDDLKNLYTSAADLQGFPVKDWASFQGEKGGLRGAIEFAPLQEYSVTYQTLIQARDLVKAQINEVEGINDFQRGIQQSYVTATAASMTSSQSSSRMAVAQREVAEYIQALLRLKAHLICKFYKPENLLQVAGSMNQADAQFVPAALQLLKNEQMSHFRLDVSVDSIQDPNWNAEKAERNELIQAFGALMTQSLPLVQQVPAAAPMVMSLMKFAVSGYKGSTDIEGAIDSGLDQMAQAMAQKQSQPPEPSPAQVKAQAAQQAAQVSLQTTQLQEQTKQQIAQMDAQLKAQKLQIDALIAQTKAKQVDANIAHQTAQLKFDALGNSHGHAIDISSMLLPPRGGSF